MTKLIKTLIAGLTLLGVLSVSSLANATEAAAASSQLFEFVGGGIPADAAAKIKNDEGSGGDKFYYKHTGGVSPQ